MSSAILRSDAGSTLRTARPAPGIALQRRPRIPLHWLGRTLGCGDLSNPVGAGTPVHAAKDASLGSCVRRFGSHSVSGESARTNRDWSAALEYAKVTGYIFDPISPSRDPAGPTRQRGVDRTPSAACNDQNLARHGRETEPTRWHAAIPRGSKQGREGPNRQREREWRHGYASPGALWRYVPPGPFRCQAFPCGNQQRDQYRLRPTRRRRLNRMRSSNMLSPYTSSTIAPICLGNGRRA